jgi:DNA polymerase-1
MPDKILLLDSNSLMHRAYHALPQLKTSKGLYTGAIYGFMTILLRLIKEQQPTHIAAAFDLKGPTFRNQMYAQYKANRKPMDEELRVQVEPLKQLISALGIKIVCLEGYEGDDILGTLAKRFEADTSIVTGDKDSFQLVSPTTKVIWTKRGVSDIEIYDLQKLKEEGFTPQSYIDFKAMRGDPSDNIPGIAGVGEKTAKQLLDTYGSLDEVLERAGEIKGKIGEVIASSRDIALLSRKLATIDTDVPLKCNLSEIAFKPIFKKEVKEMLGELEMLSLTPRMQFESGALATEVCRTETVGIETVDGLKRILGERLPKEKKIAVYIDGYTLSFAFDCATQYTLNAARKDGEQPKQLSLFEDADSANEADMLFCDATDVLRGALNKGGIKLICYDFKSFYKKYGFVTENFFDVMIAAHLARGSASIKSPQAVFGGAEEGAARLLDIADELEKSLEAQNMGDLFFKLEQPLCVVLAKMEQRGFALSLAKLNELELKYTQIIKDLTRKIYDAAGEDGFNIGSPKQLGEVLFDRLGLRHGKKNKTGYSVGEDVLSALKHEHPIVSLILEWRHYSKLLSTYVLGLKPLVENGRIHTDFNQCITATGRLSSTNPNLQNIPARGEESKDIKSAFAASGGNTLVSADYSQIELRLLAHLSGDSELIKAYKRADDIHALTASQIYGVPISEITSAQRRDAKAVNFGIIYGMSDFGLAENLSIPKYQAKQFIERYFAKYPTVQAFLEQNIQKAKDCGYAVTMLGRRRSLPELKASNHLQRSAAERMAMNTPLQGSAADIVKLAMLGVEKRLENMKSKMILQVHDELIVDADKNEQDEVKRILKEEMENAVSLSVPLVVDVESADNWGDVK